MNREYLNSIVYILKDENKGLITISLAEYLKHKFGMEGACEIHLKSGFVINLYDGFVEALKGGYAGLSIYDPVSKEQKNEDPNYIYDILDLNDSYSSFVVEHAKSFYNISSEEYYSRVDDFYFDPDIYIEKHESGYLFNLKPKIKGDDKYEFVQSMLKGKYALPKCIPALGLLQGCYGKAYINDANFDWAYLKDVNEMELEYLIDFHGGIA